MSNPFSLGGFELDLGNLDKSSGLIITDRKRTASIVNSQDEGPTDFTDNMGYVFSECIFPFLVRPIDVRDMSREQLAPTLTRVWKY